MYWAKFWRRLGAASVMGVCGLLGISVAAGQTGAPPAIEPIADRESTIYNSAAREQFHGFGFSVINEPTSISATGMPPGVEFGLNSSSSAHFRWMDSTIKAGLFIVTITASNAYGTDTRTFRWMVHPSMAGFMYPDKGTYTVGDVITIRARYSAPVVVSGSPYIELWPGKHAVYTSGSGTTDLLFKATITANDVTHDDLVVDRIVAGSGAIATLDGVSANLVAAESPNRVGGRAPWFDVLVPGSTPAGPAVMQVLPPAPGVYGREYVPIWVRFNALVLLTGSPTLAARIGSTDVELSGGYVSPSRTEMLFSYDARGSGSANGALTVTGPIRLNGATIKGTDGTAASLSFAPFEAPNVIIDTIPPPAPVVTGVTPASPSPGQSFTIQGTAEPRAEVILRIDQYYDSAATTDASGTWSISHPPVAEGVHHYVATAQDSADNVSAATNFTVVVQPTPTGRPPITSQPVSRAAAVGSSVTFSAGTSASGATFQWHYNGAPIGGATNATYTVDNVTPERAGVYTAVVSDAGSSTLSASAILGVESTAKVVGSGQEVGANILHPNGNVYDQTLLHGAAITLTADAGQVSRASFVDLSGDITQVEFSGAGALSIVLDAVTGAAPAENYNQPSVAYMKGHAGLVITGANESTNVSVFSVGRITAVDQSIFRDGVDYHGVADLAYIAILSSNGNFGGIRAGNANFWSTRGTTGLYAPGVRFHGPVYVCEITATEDAIPMIRLGAASDAQIKGGDLLQTNGRAVQVSGLSKLRFTNGASSHGGNLPALSCRARLEENGQDVTDTLTSP